VFGLEYDLNDRVIGNSHDNFRWTRLIGQVPTSWIIFFPNMAEYINLYPKYFQE